MAYNIFPKTTRELVEKINNFPSQNKVEIISLFEFLKNKFPEIESPINLDAGQKTKVNVSRMIQDEMTMDAIKRNANIKVLNPKFGNGSSGNRGVNNRGNLFESQFADALLKWFRGESITDQNMLKSILHIDEVYNIKKSKKFVVDIVGGENTKRPLVYSPYIKLTNPKGTGTNVGKSVTDITLKTDNNEIYLSLKLGTTVTFFNVEIRKVVPPKDIKEYNIKGDGKKLLKLFGIDEKLFCDIFNGNLSKGIFKKADFDTGDMKNLLESGIGEGYHIIHKLSGKILSKKMDSIALKKAADIQSAIIYYGGKTGTGKRIDIEMESQTYKFKLNMRDTQGSDGYPTRLMCDFSYK